MTNHLGHQRLLNREVIDIVSNKDFQDCDKKKKQFCVLSMPPTTTKIEGNMGS
jgi:hypothetical protein